MLFLKIKKSKKKSIAWKKHKSHALELIHQSVKTYNLNTHFTINRITVRNQRTRWGSCSSKGNLNFNYRIVFLPQKIVDYIVIHECCHLKEFNHSSNFWNLVCSFDPNYKDNRKELKKYRFFTNTP